MTIDEKIQQALNAPDDCGYARLAKDLARFLQESRAPAAVSAAAVASVVSPVASRGRLKWLRRTGCWFLVPPGDTGYLRAYYGAADRSADSRDRGGTVQTRAVDCDSFDASVRQIVAWATADGFEVPLHPEGLGQ